LSCNNNNIQPQRLSGTVEEIWNTTYSENTSTTSGESSLHSTLDSTTTATNADEYCETMPLKSISFAELPLNESVKSTANTVQFKSAKLSSPTTTKQRRCSDFQAKASMIENLSAKPIKRSEVWNEIESAYTDINETAKRISKMVGIDISNSCGSNADDRSIETVKPLQDDEEEGYLTAEEGTTQMERTLRDLHIADDEEIVETVTGISPMQIINDARRLNEMDSAIDTAITLASDSFDLSSSSSCCGGDREIIGEVASGVSCNSMDGMLSMGCFSSDSVTVLVEGTQSMSSMSEEIPSFNSNSSDATTVIHSASTAFDSPTKKKNVDAPILSPNTMNKTPDRSSGSFMLCVRLN